MSTELPFLLNQSKIVVSRPNPQQVAWECFPENVVGEELVCRLQSATGTWLERWNLQHTLWGIRTGFYAVTECL